MVIYMMVEKGKAALLDILSAEGLLSDEQIRSDQIQRGPAAFKNIEVQDAGSAPYDRRPVVRIIGGCHRIAQNCRPRKTVYFITADVIMATVAKHLHLPFLKIDPLKLNYEIVTRIMSRPYAIKHQVVPIALSDNTLTVASADPFDREASRLDRRVMGYKVDIVLTTKADILKIITEFYGFKSAITSANKEIDAATDLGNLEQIHKAEIHR